MAQSEAPHTRGFLFADLRAYTQFVEKHGDDAASRLLSAYRTLVRTAVAQSDGAEIRTEGDAFYVVFPSASSAIRCAMAILDRAGQSNAAAGGPLPVGIGIHAGETADSAEGFVGSAVNIAARVCALAAPGELLVTETVRSLVRTSMPLSMQPRGRRHLKGIREPIALFAVLPEGATRRPLPRRIGALAASTFERRPLAAGFAALAGVAAVATVVLAIGLLANTNAFRDGAAHESGPSGGTRLGATPSPSDSGEFPNTAEGELLARLDPDVASSCKRAVTSDYPTLPTGQPGLVDRLPVRAGLRCSLGISAPDVVFLWAFEPRWHDAVTADLYFFSRVSLAKATRGDCAKDDLAYSSWSFGIRSGKLLCVATPARARLTWTFDGEAVVASAERDDGDGAALYRWWLEEGRTILH
jgi:class 3 adenylate cyclase